MDMKQLRQQANVRAETVAERLGIALSTVRNWEQGRTIPKLRLDQFDELLKIYNCGFADLMRAYQETAQHTDKTPAPDEGDPQE